MAQKNRVIMTERDRIDYDGGTKKHSLGAGESGNKVFIFNLRFVVVSTRVYCSGFAISCSHDFRLVRSEDNNGE